MRSETEKLLVDRWLLWLQLQHKLYNVDNRHQCLNEPNRSNIISMFSGMPNFFGCIICGQYHICHMDPRECVIISDAQQQRLSCHYSGLLLSESEAFVVSLGEGGDDDNVLDEESVMVKNTKKSRDAFMKKKTPYTNSRIRLPKKSLPSSFITPTIVKDVRHKESLESSESEDEGGGGGGGGDEGGESCEKGEDEVQPRHYCDGDGKNRTYHSNYDYWSEYYSFLTSSPDIHHPSPSSLTTMPVETMVVEIPVAVVEEEGGQYHFNSHLLTEEMEREITDSVRTIVERLISLQLEKVRNKTMIKKEVKTTLIKKLTSYFTHLSRNIIILVYNSPASPTLTPSQLCETLMLNIFLESRDGYDSCGYRFGLWSKNPWLSQLHGDGTMNIMFQGKKRKKKGGGGSHVYDREKIREMASDVKYCLDFYNDYDLWLKQFILTNK